jgi:hypothetical protein
MQNIKDKMYNYEVTPPSKSWQVIVTVLDNKSRNLTSLKKRSKIFYISLSAAAAITIFVFGATFWKNSSSGKDAEDKITVPKTSSKKYNPNSEGAAFEPDSKKYITITGSLGECVKISSKAAKLIVASDNQDPPKPVWSAKVNKWKDKMESNVLAPSTANFLDIVELTHALKIDD